MSYNPNTLYPKNANIGGAVTPINYNSVQSQKQFSNQKSVNVTPRHKSNHTVGSGSLDRKDMIFNRNTNGGRNPRLSNKGREEIVIKGEIFKGIDHMSKTKEKEEEILKQRMMLEQNSGLKHHNETRWRSPERKKNIVKNAGMRISSNNK